MAAPRPLPRWFGLRVRFFFGVVALGLFAAGVRLVDLQVVRGEELRRLSREEHLADLRVPARRGHIYDRHNKPLAISVDVPSVYANPSAILDARAAARTLAPLLAVDVDLLYQRLASDRLFVWLKRQISPAVAERVAAAHVAGVGVTKESHRFYPSREVAAHVIGFAGVDGRGLEGIEKQFDETLYGEPQVVMAVRDGRGRAVLGSAMDREARALGADVVLTVDAQIAHAAEEALRRGVAEAGAKAGSAVVLHVPTGEVLALANTPDFNPNEAAQAAPDARRNRAITDMFEPGSTFKPLVVAAALETRALAPDAIVFCENGAFQVGDHTIRDSKPYGWMGLGAILAHSSNIGAAKVGLELGAVRLHAALKSYGLGERSGITLPGETSGVVHAPQAWSKVELATISFGHGVAVSALQLATAYRVLASGGRYDPPVLVRSISRPDGQVERPASPVGGRVLRKDTTLRVSRMLETAVGADATGSLAAVPGFRVAGKTGTAQKVDPVTGGYSRDRTLALFAGFLPAEAPVVVITVVVDEPKVAHSGGAVAAPIFAEIAEATMLLLGVVPSAPLAPKVAVMTPRVDAEGEATPTVDVAGVAALDAAPQGVPSFVGLSAREAVARSLGAGQLVALEMQGSGRVVRQEPAAGQPPGQSARVRLILAEP